LPFSSPLGRGGSPSGTSNNPVSSLKVVCPGFTTACPFRTGAGVTSRAVFVIDANDKITYLEYVPEIAQEPDYNPVLDAAKATA